MIDAPVLAWVLAAPAALGAAAVRAVGVRWSGDGLWFAALVWPAGCLVLGAAELAMLVLGVELRFWWVAPIFLVPALLLLRRGGDGGGGDGGGAARGGGRGGRGGTWFLAAVWLGVAWSLLQVVAGAQRPCIEGDEGNIWSLQAKSLVLDWPGGGYAAAQCVNLHPDYPLLNPLLQAWVQAHATAIEHFANRLPVQLCGVALWLMLCAALRRLLPAWLAFACALVVLLAEPFQRLLRTAYADGMVALGVLIAVDGWLRWRDAARRAADSRDAGADAGADAGGDAGGDAGAVASDGGRDDAAVAVRVALFGAAFALFSKNEATLYAVAAVAAGAVTFAVRRGRRAVVARAAAPRQWPWLLLPAGVVAVQLAWNAHFGLRNDLLGANASGRSMFELMLERGGERAGVVLAQAAAALGSPTRPHGVFLVLLLAPLLWTRVALGPLLPLTLTLLASIAGMHLVYLGTHLDLRVHLDTSYHRVLFHLVPATLVWFAALARHLVRGDDPPRAAAA